VSDKTSNGRVIKAGIGYTIGNMMVRGLGFFALPFFSRIMDTDQFGVYNGFVAVDSILYVISGLALHSSIKSAHYKFKGKTDDYVSSLLIIYVLNYVILNTVVIIWGNYISDVLDLPRISLYMLVLFSSSSAILTLYTTRISIDYSYKQYLKVSLCNTVGSISLSMLLMLTLFNNQRAMGRIVGSTLTIAIIAVYIVAKLWKKASPTYSKEYWKFGIRYSLPIIPHGISQVLLSQFDRLMIRSLDSNASAGIYSLAANIKIILTVISESISTVWSTWFFEEIDRDNRETIQKRAIQLLWVFMLFSLGMIAIAPELILLLGGLKYEQGKYVAYPMIIDAFILFMYNIIVPSEYYKQKTNYIMFGTMAAAIINVITNYVFIKKYGFIAAAYTTLFSYICYLLLHTLISHKLVGFHIIPLKQGGLMILILSLSSVINMLVVDIRLYRYIFNFVSMGALSIVIYRYLKRDGVDIVNMIKNRQFKH